MKTKHIDNQEQLREAKKNLKIRMKLSDKELGDNWIFNLIKKLTGGGQHPSQSIDENTKKNIKFLAAYNSKKIDYVQMGKRILPIIFAIAAPILAKKLIDSRKHK